MSHSLSLASAARSGLTIGAGRLARLAARVRGGGSGGTALPGLVMEKLDPGFLARTLSQLDHGVIVVSGTNGKTTTTKMVVQLLESQGLRVLTNRTGSNFVRGVLASLLTEVSWTGRCDADVAVLELDEAHAVRFTRLMRPRATLVLNVMRDQLDRFGEIDYTASLLHTLAQATTDVVVTNADDPRLGSPSFTSDLHARVASFGAGPDLADVFLSDDDLRTGHATVPAPAEPATGTSPSDPPGATPPEGACGVGHRLQPRVRLDALDGHRATVRVDGTAYDVDFTLPGIHNQLNACAALALVLEVLGDGADLPSLLAETARIEPAFGRGEVLTLDGQELELSLVKNPAGFRMGLLTAAQVARREGETIMIAINDEYADGRDMSWLWDVDFSALREGGVAVVTGVRAWDMALRLTYEGVTVRTVEPDLGRALAALRQEARECGRRTRVFTTYTAMLALRRLLSEVTDVEEVMR